MLNKANDSTDYITKIKELENEIKIERLNQRTLDKKKLKELHNNGYGNEGRDFQRRLLESEDQRIKIKKDKLLLLNAKREKLGISPIKARTIETTMTELGNQNPRTNYY